MKHRNQGQQLRLSASDFASCTRGRHSTVTETMPISVRVQAAGAPVTLSLEDGASIDDLRSRIAAELGIPAGTQEIRSGFPPTLLAAAGDALVSAELGAQARILVKSVEPSGGGTSASAGSSSGGGGSGGGGGRKKPQAQRVQNGENPRDAQEQRARAETELAQQAAAAQAEAAALDADREPPLPAKRGRTQTRPGLTPEESAMELLGDDAPKPRAPKSANRGVGSAGAGAGSSSHGSGGPSTSGASGASATAATVAPPKAARAPKAKTAQQIASEYFVGAPTAPPSASARGGATRDFLTDHGTVEHRVAALQTRKYALEEVGKGQLQASYKAVRKEIRETVQLLGTEQIAEVLRALAARGSSSRGRSNNHLLAPREMAARSPALLWSLAYAFGDVEDGVRQLQQQ